MLTAHLPAGYLLGRSTGARRGLLAVALAASVLPDFDMIWFLLVDERAVHHHRYWVHIPGFWVATAALAIPMAGLVARRALPLVLMLYAAILLHLILDSVGGGVLWLWPFDRTLYALVTVPATQDHWVWSFVLHWTFLPEIAIWAAAGLLWFRSRTRGKQAASTS